MPSSSPGLDLEFRTRSVWVAAFRTVTTTLILLVASIQLERGARTAQPMTRDLIWFFAVGLDYLSTLVVTVQLRRASPPWTGWLQVSSALSFAAAMVSLTDAPFSPFWFTFLLAIVAGAVLLGRRGAVGAAAGSIALTIGVLLFAGQTVGQPARFAQETLTQTLAQVLVAVLSGYLAEQLLTTRGRLAASVQDLARTNRLRDRIVSAIPSGLVFFDRDDHVLFVNPAGRAMLGYSEDEVIDTMNARALFPTFDSIRKRKRAESLVPTRRGERLLGFSASSVDDGLLLVFQDLTELRIREGEIARLDQLAELGKLSASLAHEVRNPLASMRGSAQLLAQEAEGGSREQRLASIIVREADRLETLVQQYLSFSRPALPAFSSSRLDLLVQQTLDILRADPLARGIAIDEELEVVEGEVDPGQVKQVMLNLVRNALRAAGPGGRVKVRVRGAAGEGHVSVWDSAGSLAAEDVPHVFEPFFSRDPSGTGLGLSTVQSIVHAHHGVVTVTSSPEAGTTFTVTLPLSREPQSS